MPELPEVETVCRGLAKSLARARITLVEQRRADLRAPMPKNLPARLQGRRVESVKRRAKYILATLDSGDTLLLHLGMSGRMTVGMEKKQPGKHDHLVFHFDNGVTVHFNDPRRFGLCDLIAANDLQRHKLLRGLGMEPLGPRLTGPALAKLFKGKKVAVKNALMDQRLIAGIGNIYACEALFGARISPKRRAGKCKPEEINRLAASIKKVLRAAIAAGGSSLRDYVQASGEFGYFQHQFAVYGREGERCRGCSCNIKKTGGVRRIAQGGRSTFYCPVKQV